MRRTHSSAVGWLISLARVCYGDSQVAKHFLRLHLIFQPIWGWGEIPHQKELEISVGIFIPT